MSVISCHTPRQLFSSGALPMLGLVSLTTGCLQATNANINCGSSSQSLLPSSEVEVKGGPKTVGINSYTMAEENAKKLGLRSGLGGYFAYSQKDFEAKLVGPLKNFHDKIAQCAVRFMDAGMGYQSDENSKNSAGNRKLLVWSSRNCINYEQITSNEWEGSKAYLKIGTAAIPYFANVPRFLWPQNMIKTVFQSSVRYQEAARENFSPHGFASPHNMDRFIVEVGEPATDDRGPVQLSHFAKILRSQKKELDLELAAIAEQKEQAQLLMDWIFLMEKQNILRAVAAMKPHSFKCTQQNAIEKVCQDVKADLREEHNAVMENFRVLWTQNISSEHFEFDSFWKEAWEETETLIESVRQTQNKKFANISRTVESAFNNSGESPSETLDFLGENEIENLLFFKSHSETVNDVNEGPSGGVLKYTAWPLSIFFAHQATAAKHTQDRKQGNSSSALSSTLRAQHAAWFEEAEDTGAGELTALLFQKPVVLNWRDEGSVVSLMGLYPFAVLSMPQVSLGQAHGDKGTPPENTESTRDASLQANGCN